MRFKRSLRRILPRPLLDAIQKVRKLGYKPAERIALMKARHDELQMRAAPDEIVLRHGIKLRIHPQSREPFEWFCWRSPNMVDELDLFLQKSDGARCFLDAGANHGIFSLAFLKINPGSSVISIDPSPIAHEIRQANARLNGFGGLVCEQVACGNSNGRVSMHFNWHHLEIAPELPVGAPVEVPMETIDSICAKECVQPEIVKIDVEGFEKHVLGGAANTLRSAKVLFIEIHPDPLEKLKVPQRDIYEFLVERGWRVRELNGRDMRAEDFAERFHTFWTVCERQ